MKNIFPTLTLGLSLALILGDASSYAQTTPPPTPVPAPATAAAPAPAAAPTAAAAKPKRKKPYVDIAKLKHDNYTSYYSKSQHIPVLVTYTVTADMLWCEPHVPQSNKFAVDPQLPGSTNNLKDYVRSGYDKGQNMGAANNICSEDGMDQSFYFSNVTPMPHFFNTGIWENLGKSERQEARTHGEVMVSVGALGKKTTIGAHKIVVPKYIWKVVYIPSDDMYYAYMFPNSDAIADDNFNSYRVKLSDIKTNAGVYFENGLAVPNK
ncbi:MAG: DNA/RNA non-specific endonuclease [Bacteroidetes bacterium]|nr:DNA/RNA non-specific endonuclease [Bacteroidota bacterium]